MDTALGSFRVDGYSFRVFSGRTNSCSKMFQGNCTQALGGVSGSVYIALGFFRVREAALRSFRETE